MYKFQDDGFMMKTLRDFCWKLDFVVSSYCRHKPDKIDVRGMLCGTVECRPCVRGLVSRK